MSTDKVQVAVRVRPVNRREIALGTKCVIDMEKNQTVLYHPKDTPLDASGKLGPGTGDGDRGRQKPPKSFAFDHCFWSMDKDNPKFASQQTVFHHLGESLLERAFEGYNGCIFAYGQTGSGKSYTMMGTMEEKGIIPRLCDALFDSIAKHENEATCYKVEVSYMEIYNEKVHDLLDLKGNKQNLKVREHNILGPYVDGLSTLVVTSFEDINNLMNEGNKSRTVAATNMNSESSRSHAVFNIILTTTLVDLQTSMSVTTLKEEGNERFKNGDYEKALSLYTEALDLGDIKDTDKAVIYKNRAMCHLKLEEFDDAIKDATSALEISPNDPKALYRRSMAYEQQGQLEDAYRDAVLLVKVDPKNTSVKPLLNRLTPIMKEKAKKQTGTKEKINQMFNLAFDSTVEKEKRLQAANNLVVITRDDGGSESITEVGGIEKLKEMLNKEKDPELLHAFIRIFACLARLSKSRCLQIYNEVGVVRLGQVMALPVEGLPTSVALLLQNMLESIADLPAYRAEKEKHDERRRRREPCRQLKFELDDFQQAFVDEVFSGLVKMLQHVKVSAYGRDAAMELLIKLVSRKTGLHWTRKFLDTDGIEALLTIAGAMKQHETLPVTDLSKTHAALLLNTLWEDLLSEKENDIFKEKVGDFFKEMFGNEDWESKVEAIKCISMLLQGPFEVGNMILGFEGVTEIMLGLAESELSYHQQIAVEAIVHSASKKNKCVGILKEAVPILKKLYHEGIDDKIKIRALVGLCKLGSFEGSDASNRPMADGSTITLAKACRKFMTNPQGDLDMKQWGTEGLAYLTLDAEVKEELVHDPVTVKAVIEAAMNPSPSFMYAAATLFVNLTNSADKQEMIPEMVELAKYAKQHVPEEHPKDKEEFVKERVKKLVEAGMIPALCMLSKTESQNTREQCSRVLLTVATDESYRGQMVQVGGVKVLLNLFKEKNTDLGKQVAAQTLAKLAITQDPNLAFSGQRMYEIVKPLIALLHIDRTGLQNFEALLALTNLASMSDSVRNRIVSERGLPSIEHWMYEDHEMIRRAAIECMCNMVMNEKVAKLFEGENDRLKFFLLQCGDDDEKVQKAAAGALAVLTIDNAVICKKILQQGKWVELLLSVAVSEDPDIQHRGCYILRNMVSADKEVAEKVLEGQLLEVLMAVSILEAPEKQAAKQCALEALGKAEELGIIKKNTENS